MFKLTAILFTSVSATSS